ncbi:hypothetical protein [Streptomyces sp. NPDC127066]|uniref:hypothetical protein n=1 Tax=Streptomyces sp. NPDC127066 TaxID=3347125 RepID=UPI003658E27F
MPEIRAAPLRGAGSRRFVLAGLISATGSVTAPLALVHVVVEQGDPARPSLAALAAGDRSGREVPLVRAGVIVTATVLDLRVRDVCRVNRTTPR